MHANLVIIQLVLLTALHCPAETRVVSLDLNDWQVAPDPGNVGWKEEWWREPRNGAKAIRVPGVIQEEFPGYHGVAWYWTDFIVPLNLHADGRTLLRFSSINYKADYWLGGTYLGGSEGGETLFEFDITTIARASRPNRLAIRVLDPRWEVSIDGMTKAETPRRGGVAFQHGGIEGSVELLLTPAARIMEIFAQPDWKTGKIRLLIKLLNASNHPLEGYARIYVTRDGSNQMLDCISVRPYLKPGEVVVEADLQVQSPLLWDVDSPNLYKITAELKTEEHKGTTDTSSIRTGFRDFRFVDGAFRLNGKRVLLRSVQHSHFDALRFWIPYDLGADPDYFQRRFIAAKEMGFNCIRIFGGVPPRNLVELADQIGLMLYVESNASWELRDSLHVRQRFQDHIRNMILRDRNHPSIVMWGLLNETHTVDRVARIAVESLPLVRQLDPSRMVMLSSGRYDYDLRIGSLSNPGEYSWQHLLGSDSPKFTAPARLSLNRPGDAQAESLLQHILKTRHKEVTGDLHHYAYFPLQPEERRFYREVGANTKPIFFSEFGRGSGLDVVSLWEFYEQHKATHLEPAGFVKLGVEKFMKHWRDYKLGDVFTDPKTFFEQSMIRSAQDRKSLFNAIRSNPHVAGFNNVALSERIMAGHGLMTLDGKVKPEMKAAMLDALAPVRFCVFTEPINIYLGASAKVEVVLANSDALPPGQYPIVVQLSDGADNVIFEKETTIDIPATRSASEPPFSFPVLNETVLISGKEGRYKLMASFKDGRTVPGGVESMYVFDREQMPKVETDITLWGEDPQVRTWLAANGIRFKEFTAEGTGKRELILVTANPPAPGGFDVFGLLARRIATGSAAVFLSEKVFAEGNSTTRWLPLKAKGIITKSRSWIYGRDEWVKDHPVFQGLQNKGLMDLQYYRELLDGTHPVFTNIEQPEVAIAGCFQTSSFDRKLGIYHHGLIMAEFPFGRGRILLNTLLVSENLGRVPQAERLLRNMLNHMSRDLSKPTHEVPADFAEQIAALYAPGKPAAPEIAIIAPHNLTTVKAPGTIPITVWTAEPETKIAKVEFYSNGLKIGEDRIRKSESFLPFEHVWQNVLPGSYELSATAIHEGGGSTSSEKVSVVVK